MNLLRCRLCGGELLPPWDGTWLCRNCGARNEGPLPVPDVDDEETE